MAQLNNSGFDTGSNYKFGDKMIKPNFPRSLFDDSCLVTTSIDNAGLVFPIKVLEVLPNSDYEISVNSLLRVLPQAVPLYSRQRLYTYAFYSRCSDLWAGFQTFITKGYSGNEVRSVPVLSPANTPVAFTPSNPQFDNSDPKCLVGSLGDMFGLPLGATEQSLYSINAMPFMMYLRIWRDYFCNRNFYVNDRRLLPDDDSRFRLNDVGQVNSFNDDNSGYHCYFDSLGRYSPGVTTTTPKTVVASKGMSYITDSGSTFFCVAPFYHDYPADYFTSALPWTQRGNTPSIDMDITTLRGQVGLTTDGLWLRYYGQDPDVDLFNNLSGGTSSLGSFRLLYASSDFSSTSFLVGNYPADTVADYNEDFNHWLHDNLVGASNTAKQYGVAGNLNLYNVSGGNFSLTLEQLRELAITQTIMEKMARTDGSFAEFGLTFFGEKSKAATDYRPTFIGGSYSNLVFTEVLQTSETTASSALGQYAGHGIGVQNKGYLGRFHADDYGYIMILACVMPDVYYHQGLHKMWSRIDQSQWFLPERAELGMQPIYNKEIYLQDPSVVDSDNNPVNDNLFAYQDIMDEYRYQDNIITGKIADFGAKSFNVYTQARHFTSLPNWSQQFAEANDVRKDYLQAPIEVAYTAQFDLNIKAVKPLPYRARPASILNGLVK